MIAHLTVDQCVVCILRDGEIKPSEDGYVYAFEDFNVDEPLLSKLKGFIIDQKKKKGFDPHEVEVLLIKQEVLKERIVEPYDKGFAEFNAMQMVGLFSSDEIAKIGRYIKIKGAILLSDLAPENLVYLKSKYCE